jgi:hypothetical protein
MPFNHQSLFRQKITPKNFSIFTIFFLVFLLLAGLSQTYQPVQAQANPTPVPTIDPTITSLEKRVTDLETDIKILNDRKEVDKQLLENTVQSSLLPVYIWGLILSAFGVTSVVSACVWINKFKDDTLEKVKNDTNKIIDQAFYSVDPLLFPIYAPASDNFKIERERLKRLGFKNIRTYVGLQENILDGIIIYRLPEEKAYAEIALATLEDFMKKNDTQNKKMAFILYINGRLDKASDLIANYDNVVMANMPVTVAEHIYTLVRGLSS